METSSRMSLTETERDYQIKTVTAMWNWKFYTPNNSEIGILLCENPHLHLTSIIMIYCCVLIFKESSLISLHIVCYRGFQKANDPSPQCQWTYKGLDATKISTGFGLNTFISNQFIQYNTIFNHTNIRIRTEARAYQVLLLPSSSPPLQGLRQSETQTSSSATDWNLVWSKLRYDTFQ